MTNYRHGQMINLIDEMNSPLLAVEPSAACSCATATGNVCAAPAVCTTGAISLGEEGIVVSPEKCIGCGTCASACPTGCLTAANPTDEELFGAVEAALAENEGRVAIACERAFAMASGNRMKRDSCDATAPSFVPWEDCRCHLRRPAPCRRRLSGSRGRVAARGSHRPRRPFHPAHQRPL